MARLVMSRRVLLATLAPLPLLAVLGCEPQEKDQVYTTDPEWRAKPAGNKGNPLPTKKGKKKMKDNPLPKKKRKTGTKGNPWPKANGGT